MAQGGINLEEMDKFEEENDVQFFITCRQNFPAINIEGNKKGKSPSQRRRAQEFKERKQESVQKYGEAVARPQDLDSDFLLWRRKINFGLKDSSHDSHWPNPLPLSRVTNTYVGSIIPKGSPLVWIDKDNIGQYDGFIQSLKRKSAISLDFEFHDVHSYLGMTCLLQIGTSNVDLILNATNLHVFIANDLKEVLENPEKVKVVFGASNDFLNLKRDFGIHGQGFFDLQLFFHEIFLAGKIEIIMDLVPTSQARAWFLAYFGSNFNASSPQERIQLQQQKAFVKKIAYEELVHLFYPDTNFDDAAQVADFRPRQKRTPEYDDLLEYARNDVHYLLRIYVLLKGVFHQLPTCFEAASRATAGIAGKAYKRKVHPTSDADYTHGVSCLGNGDKSKLSMKTKDVFRMIHSWRDQYARIMDEAPSQIISNRDLLMIILRKDNIFNTDDILKLSKSLKNQRWAPILLSLLKEGESRNEIMKTLQCGNCGLPGHISYACPHEKNKDLVKANRKAHYATHRAQKSHQNQRRQFNKRLNHKKRRMESRMSLPLTDCKRKRQE